MKRKFLALSLLAGVVLIGCSNSESESGESSKTTGATANLPKVFPPMVALSPTTFHLIGSYKPDAKTWSSSIGEAGFLIYGPYWALSPGKYRASFRLTTSDKGAPVLGGVDVNAFTKERPTNVAATASITSTAGEQIIPLEFIVPSAGPLYEFRVVSNGKGPITVSEIGLEKLK